MELIFKRSLHQFLGDLTRVETCKIPEVIFAPGNNGGLEKEAIELLLVATGLTWTVLHVRTFYQ